MGKIIIVSFSAIIIVENQVLRCYNVTYRRHQIFIKEVFYMTKDMTNGNSLKLIISFCIPMIIGNLLQQLSG